MADEHTIPDDLADIEAVLRDLDPAELEPVAPPAAVWDGIERELADDAEPSVATVTSLTERRRFAWPLLAAAAAVVVVVVGVAAIALRDDDAETLVATAVLEHDPVRFDPLGADAAATAELVERDGRFEIVLTDTALPADLREDADLELWLIEVDASGTPVDVAPVSLLDGPSPGTYRVPDDLDPRTHTIVDISIEPRDGDEAHSGRSILRGELTDV